MLKKIISYRFKTAATIIQSHWRRHGSKLVKTSEEILRIKRAALLDALDNNKVVLAAMGVTTHYTDMIKLQNDIPSLRMFDPMIFYQPIHLTLYFKTKNGYQSSQSGLPAMLDTKTPWNKVQDVLDRIKNSDLNVLTDEKTYLKMRPKSIIIDAVDPEKLERVNTSVSQMVEELYKHKQISYNRNRKNGFSCQQNARTLLRLCGINNIQNVIQTQKSIPSKTTYTNGILPLKNMGTWNSSFRLEDRFRNLNIEHPS